MAPTIAPVRWAVILRLDLKWSSVIDARVLGEGIKGAWMIGYKRGQLEPWVRYICEVSM